MLGNQLCLQNLDTRRRFVFYPCCLQHHLGATSWSGHYVVVCSPGRPGGGQTGGEKRRAMSIAGRGIKRASERAGRGGATSVVRWAPDYQPASDALETDQAEERATTAGRPCVCESGCKDDRHQKRSVGGHARGEIIEEGQWMSLAFPKSYSWPIDKPVNYSSDPETRQTHTTHT